MFGLGPGFWVAMEEVSQHEASALMFQQQDGRANAWTPKSLSRSMLHMKCMIRGDLKLRA